MGLLDIPDPQPLYEPPRRTGRFNRESAETQGQRDSELNNLGHNKMTEDFSDSPHLNY